MGEGKTKYDTSEGNPKSVTESPPPPPQGYPFPPPYQGPPRYSAYPNPNYHQYGPQPTPPPGKDPATGRSNFVLIGPPQRSNAYKFARVFLTLMIILFFALSVISLISWLIYGSDIPVFYAQSLNMTVFSLDNMGLNATWYANVSVKNPSNKDEVAYDYVEAALVYEDHILDTNYANPFVLGKADSFSTSFMFLMPNARQKKIGGALWEKDIEYERREKGSITFDIRIIVNAVFKRYDRHASRALKILCDDLEVAFPSPVDTAGKLNKRYKECLLLTDI